MKYSTIAVIYNPNSTGSSETMAKNFADSVKEKIPSQKIELIATKYAGHAEKLAYKIAKDFPHPLIISSSGDGGYNEVINGALKAQSEGATPTTGLLPAGNANDHFHNLHRQDLIDLVSSGTSQKIDVLKMSYAAHGKSIERYAHSYIGFGLTPSIGKELNKTKLNILNEVWVVGRALLSVKSVKLKIGKNARHYDSVILSNVDKMSKYLKISQPSQMSDGKFEVTIFKRRNKIKLIALLLKASLVGLKEDDQVSSFTLHTVQRTIAQTDGEVLTIDPNSTIIITAEKQLLTCII